MLLCENGHYYIGYTTDVNRRYQEHVAGTAKCKYTRSFPPVKLVASWATGSSLSDALKYEKQLKQLSRKEKIQLGHQPSLISQMILMRKPRMSN